MKIVVNEIEYTKLTGLDFEPETDLSGDTVPINEFQCDIITDSNDITFGKWAELRDDLDNLWARYWLVYAERINRETVRIIGQSPLVFLNRVTMPAKMYNTTADDILEEIMASIGDYGQEGDIIEDTDIEDAFENLEVVGFCPEQSARERLQWLLLCTGGYIKSYFDTVLRIKMIDSADGVLIPINRTFWKPSLTYRDYVTEIKVDYYTFTAGTPTSTDEYVTDGTNYWIAQRGQMSVTNTSAPQGAPENVVYIEGVTLISHDLAYGILYRLVDYYFNRAEIEADVINNAEYMPGQRVFVYTEEDKMYQAYINRASFKFGLQARSRLSLTGAEAVEVVKLTILYKWGDIQIAKRTMCIPKLYQFETTTDYIDWTMGGHRYIFRPTAKKISVMLEEDSTVTVNVAVALDYYAYGSTRDIYDNQEQQVLALVGQYYDTLISKAKGNKKDQLRAEYRDRVDTIKNAYHALTVGMDAMDSVLYIVNADGLELDGVEVVDEDSIPTVYIDGDNRTDSGGDTPQPEPDPEPGAVTLTQIYLSAYPTKTTYIQGDALDLTGVAVTARYSNGTNADVTGDCTFSPVGGTVLATVGTQDISVSYTYSGVTKTTTMSVTVTGVRPIPNVTYISAGAYKSDPTITEAIYPSVTYVEESAFFSCPNLSLVSLPVCLDIGQYAFASCPITSLSLPEVVTIGTNAFRGANITALSLPNVRTINTLAFVDCYSLNSIYAPQLESAGSAIFAGIRNGGLSEVDFPALTAVPERMFDSCYTLQSTSVPVASVIGKSAFRACVSLSTIYTPQAQIVSDYAFCSCWMLESISLPALTQVKSKAFECCSKLSAVYLPNSVVASCGASVFGYSPIADSSYLGNYGSIYVPSSLASAYKSAPGWSVYSERIVGI